VPFIDDTIPSDAKEVIQMCCQRDASLRPTAAQLLNNSFFQVSAPTPMKHVKKRLEKSLQRSPSMRGSNSQPSPLLGQQGKRLSNTLLKFSAFSEPQSNPSANEIPDLVVHAPEDEELND
jgi:serine/threonine protein kinase